MRSTSFRSTRRSGVRVAATVVSPDKGQADQRGTDVLHVDEVVVQRDRSMVCIATTSATRPRLLSGGPSPRATLTPRPAGKTGLAAARQGFRASARASAMEGG